MIRRGLNAVRRTLASGLARLAASPRGARWALVEPGFHCVPDIYGRSAHKHVDIRTLPGFGSLAAVVVKEERTLLYYDRLYTLYQALAHAARLQAGGATLHLAEVGVYRGGSSAFMARAGRQLGLSAAVLHCFDTFEGHSQVDIDPGADRESVHHAGLFGDTRIADVQQYLSALPNVRLYKGRIQETAAAVEQLRFRVVHIDVDIHAPTAFALRFFGDRLDAGGVIVVDDYGFTTCVGVLRAVDDFLRENDGYFALHLLTGQCVLLRWQC